MHDVIIFFLIIVLIFLPLTYLMKRLNKTNEDDRKSTLNDFKELEDANISPIEQTDSSEKCSFKLTPVQETLKFEIDKYGLITTNFGLSKDELYDNLSIIYPEKDRKDLLCLICKYLDHIVYRGYRTLADKILSSQREFLFENGCYSHFYLPLEVKQLSYNKFLIWLVDISNLYIPSEQKLYNISYDYPVYNFIKTIHDFQNNRIHFLSRIMVNKMNQIIYYDDNCSIKSLSDFNTKSVDYKIFEILKRIFVKDEQKFYDESMIRSMSWQEFEAFIEKAFANNGYSTILTPPSWDKGKDIVASKDGITYFIECKHWSTELVGREYLQKLVGAAIPYNVNQVIFITTSGYHENAFDYARSLNKTNIKIFLWGMSDILKFVNTNITHNIDR